MAKAKGESSGDALQDFLNSQNTKWGENSLIDMGSQPLVKHQTIPTGVFSFDAALGGGFAKGRLIELYGPESSGKSTLSMLAVAEEQKLGGRCAYIDLEQTFDPLYAQLLGIDVSKVFMAQPEYAEKALDQLQAIVESGLFSIVVFDSIAALTPKAELEGDAGEKKIGVTAQLMAQALRKLSPIAAKNNVTVIFINQLREKIGIMFGNPEVTTGGNSMKFFASQRIDIRKGTQIKENEQVIGGIMKLKVVKNKIGVPFKTAEVDVIYGKGIDKDKDFLKVGVDLGIITKSGSWFSYEDTKLGQGAAGAVQTLKDNPELEEIISKQLRDKLNESKLGV